MSEYLLTLRSDQLRKAAVILEQIEKLKVEYLEVLGVRQPKATVPVEQVRTGRRRAPKEKQIPTALAMLFKRLGKPEMKAAEIFQGLLAAKIVKAGDRAMIGQRLYTARTIEKVPGKRGFFRLKETAQLPSPGPVTVDISDASLSGGVSEVEAA